MKDAGCQVVTASDAEEGRPLLLDKRPDLIITDIMMPGTDGLQLAQELKSNVDTSHIPLIMLTARAGLSDKLQGLRSGAEDYVTKPFHPDELLQRCANLIRQRRKLIERFAKDPFFGADKNQVNELDDEFLKNAIALVQDRLGDPAFNVESFCREIGMSRTSLYNKLRSLTGKNISEFIRILRLRKAARLISTNAGSIFEIATMVGYNSRQSFNRSFKDEFGVSPTQFRKSREMDKNLEYQNI